jgi:hypothetical protein
MSQTLYSFNTAIRMAATVAGEERIYTGFVLSSNEDCFVIARYTDLRFSGLVWLDRNATNARVEETSSITTFFEEVVMRLERSSVAILEGFEFAVSIKAGLDNAMNLRNIVIIEGRNADEFEVCKVMAVSKDQAVVCNLFSDGTWDKTGSRIKIKNISALTVLDPYCVALEEFFTLSEL